MLVILGFAAGIVLGVRKAGNAGGSRLDKFQYGAVFGIAFAIAGLFVTLVAGWLGL
ncbi:MAG: hypothetical protein OXF74_01145 [Rhodobacteraceae bacterium]|nr:hypothetical protein [Paracoccaceae bacterium]